MRKSRFISLYRFFGMYAPFQSLRVAAYRKAGVHIGSVAVFGSHVFIGSYGDVTIEDGVSIQFNTHISASYYNPQREGESSVGGVTIKRGAYVGMDVIILEGVTVGENSVVAAGSVVNRDVPANCMVAGVPAKVKKHLK